MVATFAFKSETNFLPYFVRDLRVLPHFGCSFKQKAPNYTMPVNNLDALMLVGSGNIFQPQNVHFLKEPTVTLCEWNSRLLDSR
jgi:hypothetical protein